MSEIINKGSKWRKWDLHIHTPNTKANNNNFKTYSSFIKKIEESEIDVFWITDYFSFDENEFIKLQILKWKIFFPNIEFRIDQKNKDWEFINIHVIFNNNTEVINRIGDLLTRLSLFNENDIDGTKFFCSDLWDKLKYDKAILKLDDLLRVLKDNFNQSNYLIAWAPNWYWWFRPWNDSRWPEYAKWIDKISKLFLDSSDTIETANLNRKFFLSNRYDNSIKKPLVYCSDSHCEDFIWDKFTWIKADTTFEWLKQVIYEPEGRIHIWENKPSDNLNKIQKIELNFQKNIKISTWVDGKEYDFCFSDVKKDLHLSDYFNCFIWWRWSWKSSLLNLIYCHISQKFDTEFLENNYFTNFDIQNDIQINYNWEIEFLWQNKIEQFATDYAEFSKAIYKRLKYKDDLKSNSVELLDFIQSLTWEISNIKELEQNNLGLKELHKNLISYQNIVDIVKSEEYNNLKKEFDESKKKYYEIEQSKIRYHKFKDEYESFIENYTKIDICENDYDYSYNLVFSEFEKINKQIKCFDFQEIEEEQRTLLEKWKQEKTKIDDYLSKKWLSEEKLKNLEEAQDELLKSKISLEKYNKEIDKYNKLIESFDIEKWRLNYDLYKSCIEKWLEKAELELNKINNNNIKKFEFKVDFNIEKAKEDLLEDFINQTFNEYKIIGLRSWILKESLFDKKADIYSILSWKIKYKDFLDYIESLEWVNNEVLKDIFKTESNFEIYRILIAKYLYNLNDYLKINIIYDDRPIESSSFWQKCTVVILIMLLFWNEPIIIDEPEAHLDSSLIANFLVDLIKKRKKERQIIFATHNANFVINGDAEQIYILENEENKTSFTQTTIENLDNRKQLQSLEWWKEAFELRWKRYWK